MGWVRPFDIERRCASGPPLGQRWVAGKVVNESYGTEKQQHTFTVSDLRRFEDALLQFYLFCVHQQVACERFKISYLASYPLK